MCVEEGSHHMSPYTPWCLFSSDWSARMIAKFRLVSCLGVGDWVVGCLGGWVIGWLVVRVDGKWLVGLISEGITPRDNHQA